MLRVLLLVSSLLVLTVDVGSAAIVFYNDKTLWNAANSASANDDFSLATFSGVQTSPYVSTTGASISSPYASYNFDVNSSTGKNIWTPAGSGDTGSANGPTQVWDNDFTSGRYLKTGQGSYFDTGGMEQWGHQEEQWNETTQQWERLIDRNYIRYAGSQQVSDIDLALPAGFQSAAFDIGQASGMVADRTFRVIVNTILGETTTVDLSNIYGTLSFFGFQAATGDTISSIRISALFVPFPTPNYGNWSYEANNTYRTRGWSTGAQTVYDLYQLGLDNLWVGSGSGVNPPPPPPDGGGGEVPEPSTLLLVACGLFLLSRCGRKASAA
jgi:hypothetical protein